MTKLHINRKHYSYSTAAPKELYITLSKPSRCVSIQLVYIFTSYTTINIIIHTIKCYKFNGCIFRSPLRPSQDQEDEEEKAEEEDEEEREEE